MQLFNLGRNELYEHFQTEGRQRQGENNYTLYTRMNIEKNLKLTETTIRKELK
jgi:hypothetical protein